jgi:hypothetical protein
MKITDLDGNKIEVTDLALAILQADDYRHYRFLNPSPVTCIAMPIGKIYT